MDLEWDLKGYLKGDLKGDFEVYLEGDFRGDFKQDLEGDLLSSSGQLRSRSCLVQVWFSIELNFFFELDFEVGRLVVIIFPSSRSGPALAPAWSQGRMHQSFHGPAHTPQPDHISHMYRY